MCEHSHSREIFLLFIFPAGHAFGYHEMHVAQDVLSWNPEKQKYLLIETDAELCLSQWNARWALAAYG